MLGERGKSGAEAGDERLTNRATGAQRPAAESQSEALRSCGIMLAELVAIARVCVEVNERGREAYETTKQLVERSKPRGGHGDGAAIFVVLQLTRLRRNYRLISICFTYGAFSQDSMQAV